MAKAGTQDMILSQFPHKPGEPSRTNGKNTFLNYAETFKEEGGDPDIKFRVTVPNARAMNAAVYVERHHEWWDKWPSKFADETHCARSVYNSIQAGGVPLTGQDDDNPIIPEQLLPGNLGDILLELSKRKPVNGQQWKVEVIK